MAVLAPVRLSSCQLGKSPIWLVAVLVSLVPFTPSFAATSSAAKPLGCLIEPDRAASIGSQVVGIVHQVHVKRGQSVRAGQVLVTLRADVERANASAAKTRAAVDAEVLAAQTGVTLAEQKQRRAQSLQAQNFVSPQAVELARGELDIAQQKLSQVKGQQRIWVEERGVAEAQLALRTVRSPFDGVVVERFVNAGERVDDRPLVRVAVIDPLRVELMVPTAQYGSFALGDSVTIRPELPGAGAVNATVQHVDRVFDAASNSFRVQLSLPNADHRLPAGLRCKADFNARVEPAGDELKLAPALAWPPRPAAQRPGKG
jgi:cobalt-zinc-cadmium efflux system membrane fusion protein